MSRIKPHGPVSPQFMTHHYGAAKPAPASDDTALLRQALMALETASSCLDGYYIPRGKTTIPEAEAAIAALRTRLGEKT
jgi:hypothetical protein